MYKTLRLKVHASYFMTDSLVLKHMSVGSTFSLFIFELSGTYFIVSICKGITFFHYVYIITIRNENSCLQCNDCEDCDQFSLLVITCILACALRICSFVNHLAIGSTHLCMFHQLSWD